MTANARSILTNRVWLQRLRGEAKRAEVFAKRKQHYYRGMTIIQTSKDRWLWRDPSSDYVGCTYSTPAACECVIDGLYRNVYRLLLNTVRALPERASEQKVKGSGT